MTIKHFWLALLPFLISCENPKKEMEQTTVMTSHFFNDEDTSSIAKWISTENVKVGKQKLQMDSLKIYGPEFKIQIPDSLLYSKLKITAKGWFRAGDFGDKQIAVSLYNTSDNSLVHWTGFLTNQKMSKPNEWFYLNDTISIPEQLINKPGLGISIFPFNSNKTGYYDVDSLFVSILKTETVISE